jgi:hypothetical protein
MSQRTLSGVSVSPAPISLIGELAGMVYNSDGTWLAAYGCLERERQTDDHTFQICKRSYVRFWDARDHKSVGEPLVIDGGDIVGITIALDQQSIVIATCMHSWFGHVLDCAHGAIRRWKIGSKQMSPETVVPVNGRPVYAFATRTDLNLIGWSSADDNGKPVVEILDVRSQQPRMLPLKGHGHRDARLSFSGDGRMLASRDLWGGLFLVIFRLLLSLLARAPQVWCQRCPLPQMTQVACSQLGAVNQWRDLDALAEVLSSTRPLISEASIRSNWVNWELDEVAKCNKRLVPIMVAYAVRDGLPRQPGEIHILPAEGVFDLPRDLDALARVLENDRAWLKQASRLQDRATEWLSKGRASALLLSRGALTDAERWKDGRPTKAPSPAPEVLDLLLASRQAVARRQRWWVGSSLMLTVGALALAALAYVQSIEANRQRSEAESQAKIAEDQRAAAVASKNDALTRESYFRAEQAKQAGADEVTAALLALEGLPDSGSGDDAQRTRPLVNAAWYLCMMPMSDSVSARFWAATRV